MKWQIVTTVIQNPSEPKGQIENLRPIILLSMLRTNLAICLKKRINHRLDVEISPSQTAYRGRRETTENVFATKIFAEKTISSIIWSYVMHFSASSPKIFP